MRREARWRVTPECQSCRNQARVYGSPMFDVALAHHNLQAPWLTQADSEVRRLMSFAVQWARCTA
jgi:hypothetical protein